MLRKILNYTKSSWIIFLDKISQYSQCTYCLQEKLTHFSLGVFKPSVWNHQHSLGPKSHTRKIGNIHEDSELYQVFMHDFLCQTVSIFPFYILFTNYPNYLLLN